MEGLFAVIHYTLKEHIRNRVYLILVLFGGILIGSALIVSSLALDQQVRMILDIGLAGIEFIALMTVIFITVNLVLVEMETRSIYLILSHPIERWQYILGRYLGTIIALLLGMLAMAIFHLGTLFLEGWAWNISYLVSLGASMAKIAVIGSLALFLSLCTTSSASAMSFTAFLWILGHFTGELRFMAEKSANPITKFLLWVVQEVAPNFSYFNYRDFWQAVQTPPPGWFAWMTVYTLCYIGTALLLSSWLFSKREF